MSRSMMRALGLASLVFTIDQATKIFVRATLPLCTEASCEYIDSLGPLSLVRVGNRGGALGLSDRMWLWALLVGLCVVLITLFSRSGRAAGLLEVGAGLQLGGVLGNIVDRLTAGSVTDFMHLGAGPVINMADVALALGAILVTIALIRRPFLASEPTTQLVH